MTNKQIVTASIPHATSCRNDDGTVSIMDGGKVIGTGSNPNTAWKDAALNIPSLPAPVSVPVSLAKPVNLAKRDRIPTGTVNPDSPVDVSKKPKKPTRVYSYNQPRMATIPSKVKQARRKKNKIAGKSRQRNRAA